MKIKVGVIFGGESVEHEVSIISAVQAMGSINVDKYEVVPIYIDKKRNWYTGSELLNIDSYKNMDLLMSGLVGVTLCKIDDEFVLLKTKGMFRKVMGTLDVVIPIVHGTNVEDGSLAGYLESVGIPYASSGVLGAALGQDKVVMKQVMESEGLPLVKYVWFYDYEYMTDKENVIKKVNSLKYPVIVKPASLGSSVGISIAHNEEELVRSIDEATLYDVKVVVEEVVSDLVEVNASVLGNYEVMSVSELEEVMGEDEFLSYKDKYVGGGSKSKGMASTNRVIPARVSDEVTREVKDLAIKVFKVLNLRGIVRIDFLVDKKKGKVYVNEPNTIPGSLSYYLWRESGKSYKELLEEVIKLAIKDYKNKHKKVYSFDTNILQNVNSLKGGKGVKGKLKM